jgi:hypothetical protein
MSCRRVLSSTPLLVKGPEKLELTNKKYSWVPFSAGNVTCWAAISFWMVNLNGIIPRSHEFQLNSCDYNFIFLLPLFLQFSLQKWMGTKITFSLHHQVYFANYGDVSNVFYVQQLHLAEHLTFWCMGDLWSSVSSVSKWWLFIYRTSWQSARLAWDELTVVTLGEAWFIRVE